MAHWWAFQPFLASSSEVKSRLTLCDGAMDANLELSSAFALGPITAATDLVEVFTRFSHRSVRCFATPRYMQWSPSMGESWKQ